jgi:hypothetical protein
MVMLKANSAQDLLLTRPQVSIQPLAHVIRTLMLFGAE